MGSGFADERRAIESRFSSMYDTTPVQYENVPFSRPRTEWVSLSVLNMQAGQISLGDNTQYHRFPGMVTVSIFVPEDKGTQKARELADEISDVFRNAEFSVGESGLLVFRTPGIEPIGTRDGWYQMNVTVVYRRDKLI